MKKKIALLAMFLCVIYIIWEWWQGIESPCGCNAGTVATGNTSLPLTAFSLLDDQIKAVKGGVIECTDNNSLNTLIQNNQKGLISVTNYTTEDGTETALFYVDSNQVKHRILTSNL